MDLISQNKTGNITFVNKYWVNIYERHRKEETRGDKCVFIRNCTRISKVGDDEMSCNATVDKLWPEMDGQRQRYHCDLSQRREKQSVVMGAQCCSNPRLNTIRS